MYLPKFAGKYSKKVSFKLSSVRLINWVKPSGNLQRGFTLQSISLRHLQHLILSGILGIPLRLRLSSSKLTREEIAAGNVCMSLSAKDNFFKPVQ